MGGPGRSDRATACPSRNRFACRTIRIARAVGGRVGGRDRVGEGNVARASANAAGDVRGYAKADASGREEASAEGALGRDTPCRMSTRSCASWAANDSAMIRIAGIKCAFRTLKYGAPAPGGENLPRLRSRPSIRPPRGVAGGRARGGRRASDRRCITSRGRSTAGGVQFTSRCVARRGYRACARSSCIGTRSRPRSPARRGSRRLPARPRSFSPRRCRSPRASEP